MKKLFLLLAPLAIVAALRGSAAAVATPVGCTKSWVLPGLCPPNSYATPVATPLPVGSQLEVSGVDTTTGYINGTAWNGPRKDQRVTTGSITAGAFADVTLTWTTAFTDTNYTVVCDVIDSSSTAATSLTLDHIDSVTAATVVATVHNANIAAKTGTLHCHAMHD